mmetsp:Transcript_12246/g.17597  ORF Transcript_12246/g.17597 Transcript_12246/m.17597 type:complete len:88 (+) Transcript_12246:428-691(+)
MAPPSFLYCWVSLFCVLPIFLTTQYWQHHLMHPLESMTTKTMIPIGVNNKKEESIYKIVTNDNKNTPCDEKQRWRLSKQSSTATSYK